MILARYFRINYCSSFVQRPVAAAGEGGEGADSLGPRGTLMGTTAGADARDRVENKAHLSSFFSLSSYVGEFVGRAVEGDPACLAATILQKE